LLNRVDKKPNRVGNCRLADGLLEGHKGRPNVKIIYKCQWVILGQIRKGATQAVVG
jgi:hypothetical protein